MNPVGRTVDFTITSRVSRIPRWCRPKVLEPCNEETSKAISVVKLPPMYSGDKNELVEICEPPPLHENMLQAVWKVKSHRKQVDDRLKETVAHAEFLKQQLKQAKEKTEKISRQLEYPDPLFEYAGESEVNSELLLAKQHLRLQRDQAKSICEEKKLTRELEAAHRQLWEAGIADNLLSVEIESKMSPAIAVYDQRKEFMTKKRVFRENLVARNALQLRSKLFQTAKKTMMESNSVDTNRKMQGVQKALVAKDARNRINHHLKKAMQTRKDQKLLKVCDQQLKQDRQHRLLSHLKKEIDEQRDVLIAKNQAKKKRQKTIAEEKERIRQEFVKFGKNPYFVEHLLVIEERRAQLQRKILQKETERLIQLQKDYEITERAKKAEEFQKEKWGKFWAKKFYEKKQAKKQKEAFLYKDYDHDTNDTHTQNATTTTAQNQDTADSTSIHTTAVVLPTISTPPMDVLQSEKSKQISKPFDTKKSRKSSRMHSISSDGSGRASLDLGASRKSGGSFLRTSGSLDAGIKPVLVNRVSRMSESNIRRSMQPTVEQTENADRHKSLKPQENFIADLADIEEKLEQQEGSITTEESFWEVDEEHLYDNEVEFQIVNAGWGDNEEANNVASHVIHKHKSLFHRKQNKVAPVVRRPSFRWQPQVITFSDYEIGKTYKKTLTITNISTERCKLYLNEFVDAPKVQKRHSDFEEEEGGNTTLMETDTPIKEIVKVKNQVSKTISPGLTHEVHLAFTPQSLDDYKGYLMFGSSIESFKVSVECLKKRFMPEITPLKAVFTNVVLNTSSFMTIKVCNKGAKSGIITNLEHNAPVNSYFGSDHETQEFVQSEDHIDPSHHELDPHLTHVSHHHDNFHNSTTHSSTTDHHVHHDHHHHHGPETHSEHQHRAQHPHSAVSLSSTVSERHPHAKGHGNQTPVATPARKKLIRGILDEVVHNVTNSVFVAYVRECDRQLNEHATKTIVVFFRPPSIDTYRTHFELEFNDPDVDNIILEVEGTSMENPIFIKPLASDLKICMMDNNYQQLLTLSTSIRGAGKVVPEIPAELRQFVHVTPKKATVFANNPGRFVVKFHPKSAMLQNDNPALKFIDKDSRIIDFPIYFHLTFPYKIQSPVSATLMAILTDQQLQFEPPEIDMGKCSTVETVINSFSIVNNSMLPQQIGFMNVPHCIMIQPNFGFATLLPFEKRKFDIMVSLPEETECGNRTFSLKVQTLQQREYSLTVRALAKASTVYLSETKVFFPVTTVGSEAFTSIEIFSEGHIPGQKSSKFEFAIDSEFPISITPRAGYLQKDTAIKLVVRFKANVSEKQVKEHLLKMLEIEFVQSHAALRRELDGINQTLKYEMVFGEDDLDAEFLRVMKNRRSSSSGSAQKRKSLITPTSTRTSMNDTESASSRRSSGRLPNKEEVGKQARKSRKSDKLKISSESAAETSSGNTVKRVSKRKSSRNSAEALFLNDNEIEMQLNDPKKKFIYQAYQALERRRDEVMQLLIVPFRNLDPDIIDMHGRDFSRAKHDLMKKMVTISHHYSIPCFVTDPNGEVDILLLHVKGAVTHPSLIVLEETNTVNFIGVNLGGKAYGEIHLYNVTTNVIMPKVDLLNPMGPFLLCNALRKIPPEHVFVLKFRFEPKEAKNFSEAIRVSGGDSHLMVTLTGSCIVPATFTTGDDGLDEDFVK